MTKSLSGEDALSDVMRALADAERHAETPPHVEAAVMAGWDAAHSVEAAFSHTAVGAALRRPSLRGPILWRGAPALAAGVALAFTLTQLAIQLRVGLLPQNEVATTTLLLVGEPIHEGEPVRIVRMRVPASTLAALGVRSTSGNLTDAVDLDVIVGEDGVARAIRVGM